jgi:hypothetical protein
MSYSLQQAADAAGVNKSTVLRAIQTGKVSATRNEHGQWLIEPAELHRVYPPAGVGTGKVKGAGNDAHQDLAEANHRAAVAELEVGLLRGTIEDLRRDRDSWREQAQRLALPAPAPIPRSRWWWRRTRPDAEHNLAA